MKKFGSRQREGGRPTFKDRMREGGKPPSRSSGGYGGKPRSSYGDRPPRRDYGDRPPRREYNDRPPRRDFSDRPRPSYGDRPQRREFGDRPPRREFNDRPPRRDFSDRPRPSYGDRPQRRDFSDRPQRRDYGDRPPRRDFNDRPPRREFNDRPRRDFHDKPRRDFSDKDEREEFHGKFDRRKDFLAKAKKRVEEAYTGKGASLIQAVRTLDDLDAAKSILFTRLDEWFHINYPEFELDNEESYCKVVQEFGSKEDFEKKFLQELVGDLKAKELMDKIKHSFGSKFSKEEKEGIKQLASAILQTLEQKQKMEEFIDAQANVLLKNISHLVDPVLAARILSQAGSLERLGEMPASTIQVMGAEKSLFKHLRAGTPSPKHGVIFQAGIVRGAPDETRGKIARTLAAKLAIAAKADVYSGNFIAPQLKEALEKQLEKIKAGNKHE